MSHIPPRTGGHRHPGPDSTGAPIDPTNPYATDTPVQRGRGPVFWILLSLAIIGVMALLCCGGFGLFAYLGLGEINKEFARQLNERDEVREHFGEIESAEMNFMATGEYGQADPDQPGNPMVFDVSGTDAAGQVRVRDLPSTPELDFIEVIDAAGEVVYSDAEDAPSELDDPPTTIDPAEPRPTTDQPIDASF